MLPNLLIYLAAFFCGIAAIIVLFFTIPLQVKQAGVKNGLALLRKQLLAFGVIVFITNTIATYFLTRASISLYINGGQVTAATAILLFTFAVSKLAIAVIGYQIYHQQYVMEH